jgi:hypothetical protein
MSEYDDKHGPYPMRIQVMPGLKRNTGTIGLRRGTATSALSARPWRPASPRPHRMI